MHVVAASEGWLAAKVRGYGWLLMHAPALAARHRQLQRERTRSDSELLGCYAIRFDATNVPVVRAWGALNRLSSGYSRILQRLI
jgi:hypothetical protein